MDTQDPRHLAVAPADILGVFWEYLDLHYERVVRCTGISAGVWTTEIGPGEESTTVTSGLSGSSVVGCCVVCSPPPLSLVGSFQTVASCPVVANPKVNAQLYKRRYHLSIYNLQIIAVIHSWQYGFLKLLFSYFASNDLLHCHLLLLFDSSFFLFFSSRRHIII